MAAGLRSDDPVLEQALAWQASLESDDADWDGYAAWLEADPRHREAADHLAVLDDAIDRHRPTLNAIFAEQDRPTISRFRFGGRWLGGAVAAAVALAIGVPMLLRPEPVMTYQTGPGQKRMIALPNGATIALAPSSRMTVTGDKGDAITLAQGEAYFDVRHDPARTLAITARGYSVTDIGTRFSINLSPDMMRVGVSEGQVSVATKAGQSTLVAAGHQYVGSKGGATLSAIAGDAVGSWRDGRLVYADTPLSLVVADVARYADTPVAVDSRIADSHFSGVLTIGDGSKLLGDLSALMRVKLVRDDKGARLQP